MRPARQWKTAPLTRMTERKQQREEGQRGAEQVQPARWDACLPGDVKHVEIREQQRSGQVASTMRVGVHQREDGDVQRVPELPHHQPAVDIWDTFPLINTGRSRTG